MGPIAAAVALVAVLWTGADESMTVREFLAAADRIPRNPSAVLRSDTRRLIDEVTGAVADLKEEEAAALAAGRRPAHCIPPRGTGISTEPLLDRFNAIPAGRRGISVTQALREWMAERHPCRGATVN